MSSVINVFTINFQRCTSYFVHSYVMFYVDVTEADFFLGETGHFVVLIFTHSSELDLMTRVIV